MAKEKVLITVKTYPTYSRTYQELVCTAGFKEDGSFIRIYPMPYRKLEYAQQFEKYRWIELAAFKPASIDDVIIKETEREWKKAEEIAINKEQMDLFPEHKKLEIVKKVPYNFYYRFRDINGKKRF